MVIVIAQMHIHMCMTIARRTAAEHGNLPDKPANDGWLHGADLMCLGIVSWNAGAETTCVFAQVHLLIARNNGGKSER